MNKSMKSLWFLIVPLLLGGCSPGEPISTDVPVDRYRILAGDGTLAVSSRDRACVKDTRSMLTWELKSDQSGLHDWRNTYSWFNPSQSHNEIDYRGTRDGGSCAGSECDTWSLVAAANNEAMCGFTDWRMPSKDELYSISDVRKAKTPPTVTDIQYFPYTQSSEYWSANDYSFQPDSAWAWNFLYGHDRVDWKKSPKFVRLVRGEAIDLQEVKE
jgi:uncharacterized protein DUF1566